MYANLHGHTLHSSLDGHTTIEDYVARVKSLGHTHAAITDHGTMAGAPEFVSACHSQAITPIIGMEAYVTAHPLAEKVKESFHLTLLAMNATGYHNLVALSSLSFREGFYYHPRIDHAALAKYSEGLILGTGCLGGLLPHRILEGDVAGIEHLLRFYHELFPGRFFLEFMNHGQHLPDQRTVNKTLYAYAQRYGLPAAGTNDSHFCTQADGRGQKYLTQIRMGAKALEMGSPYTWLRDNEEMLQAFGQTLSANTLAFAEMVESYPLGSDVPRLPISPWEDGLSTPLQILTERARAGLLRRLHADDLDAISLEYEARLAHELRVIAQMSAQMGIPFERYFLNMGALTEFLAQSGIRYSTRGSAAGSLVCWVLGISSLDPIKQNLLFERFLNPYRVELPDIDLDVPDDRRDDVLRWLQQTYGDDQIARIGSYARIGPKRALEDAAKLLQYDLRKPYQELSADLKDLIPHSANPGEQTLQKVLAEPNSALAARVQQDPEAASILEIALQIGGRLRGQGTHAAGVIISDLPIHELVPVMNVSKSQQAIIGQQTQFEMEHLANLGLIKFDLLGLSELSKMEAAVQLIEEITHTQLDLEELPWDDDVTWQLICTGDTLGLFQLAGRGMTRALSQLQPLNLDELAQVIAIFRPGPLANLDQIAARKRGEEATTPIHPTLDDILAPTQGFPIYQEQLIEMVMRVAGYSAGEADLIRKAIGKKLPEAMAKHEQDFLCRGIGNGYTSVEIQHIWSFIVPFASYGFNRAHAAVYARTAFQSAYLKAHYPSMFYAAAMRTEARSGGTTSKQDRIGQLAVEARRRGVNVRPPSITQPYLTFTPDGKNVHYGFEAVKDLSTKATTAIIARGPFPSLLDLVQRVPEASSKDLITLIKAGAIPGGTRPMLFGHLDELLAIRKKKQVAARKAETPEEARARGQERMRQLFQDAAALHPEELPEYSLVECLNLELATLGLTHSSFPIVPHVTPIALLGQGMDGPVQLAGIVAALESRVSRAGRRYATLTLLDESGAIDGMVWPSAWGGLTTRPRVGDHIVVHGRVSLDQGWEQIGTLPPPSALRLSVDGLAPYQEPRISLPPSGPGLTIPAHLSYSEALHYLGGILASLTPGPEELGISYLNQTLTIPCDPFQRTLVMQRLAAITSSEALAPL